MEEINDEFAIYEAIEDYKVMLFTYNIVTAISFNSDYLEIEYTFENYDTTIHRVKDHKELIEDMKDVFFEETGIKL